MQTQPSAPLRRRTFTKLRRATATVAAVLIALAFPGAAEGQLTLQAAVEASRRASPELRAAREALTAAAGRVRQAGALLNPTLAYGREQTSRDGQTNAQDIAQFELPFEVGGQRAARREAAQVRQQGADARLATVTWQLDFDVAHAFALAVAADQRSRLAEQVTATFLEAQRVSDQRLAAGDISGYAARRLRLEAARYAAVRAAVALERRTARSALATLMGLTSSSADSLMLPTEFPPVANDLANIPLDSLVRRAQASRADVRIAMLDAEAAMADARVVARERMPTPTFSAGYKGERVADSTHGSVTGFRGIVAGFSIPLPLFDRRVGAVQTAEADARRIRAEADVVRRRVAREVTDALDAFRGADAQRAALAPLLGEGARIAVQAVQVSYAEGEISLVEWLDAIRAYQDAEFTHLALQAEVAIRRTALARAIGVPLIPSASPNR